MEKQITFLRNCKITIEPVFDREKEWLIVQLRNTNDPVEHRIIKNILDLIGR